MKRNYLSSYKTIISQHSQKKQPKLKAFIPVGLINIGNTCFLSSIIQFLYSNKDLRQDLIYRSYEKIEDITTIIGSIFDYLSKREINQSKHTKLVWQLSQLLYQKKIRLTKTSQEDALYIFLRILQQIEAINTRYVQSFDISYQGKCKCYAFIMMERILSYSFMRCQECGRQIQRILKSPSKYILYRKTINQNVEMIRQEKTKDGSKKYAYRAQIIYFGNGFFGHYIARRRQGDKQYEFNDEMVTQINKSHSDWPGMLGLIFIYQLVAQNQRQLTNIRTEKSLHKRQNKIFEKEIKSIKKQGFLMKAAKNREKMKSL